LLGIVFLTVFLDIAGFSIIFPLFPAMLDHYVSLEGEASLIGRLAAWLQQFAGEDDNAVVTLFGGVLGSVYAVLQFVFAPVWGGLSDRIGRRPTLCLTLTGTLLSYVVWVFAGSFAVLVAARVLGGIMAGNIATAAAVAADVTTGRDRAKGMGIVGMAIGLGFIFGPAIGGVSHLDALDVLDRWPGLASLGVNPFSTSALVALGLAAANLLWVLRRFPETLPPERRGARNESVARSLSPFRRLQALRFPGVVRTNLIYFLHLTAFAAMEFTLTFLAVERFGFTVADNTWMFVYSGLWIAVVQGGVVRRIVPRQGERRVAVLGLCLLVPGFVATGLAGSSLVLYVGLTFLAIGSALTMPSLSALASRYTPPDRQGLAQGTLRSMGSLSRAIGPILGATTYWRLGGAYPYWLGAAFLLLPIAMCFGLPPVPDADESA
jgi:MFS family permease